MRNVERAQYEARIQRLLRSNVRLRRELLRANARLQAVVVATTCRFCTRPAANLVSNTHLDGSPCAHPLPLCLECTNWSEVQLFRTHSDQVPRCPGHNREFCLQVNPI